MIVKIIGNIDDDARDIQAMLTGMEKIHATTEKRKWQLKCREARYLGPWAASLMLAAYLKGIQLGQSPRIRLPEEPPKLKAFCEFSGMAHRFSRGPMPNPDHPDCETIPVENFTMASWDRSNRIIRLLQRHTALDTEREDQVRTCVQEVIQNIVDHANSSIGGVMAARYIESSREVRVGIVDRGLGIAVKLREQYPDTATSELALRRVIQGGFSSRSRPNNMGLGVSNLFGLVKASGGRMALFTGDAFAEVHGDMPQPVIRPAGCIFPGTAVFFSLPVAG